MDTFARMCTDTCVGTCLGMGTGTCVAFFFKKSDTCTAASSMIVGVFHMCV